MEIPFSSRWISTKCDNYCRNINVKGSNYKNIRKDIKNICSFFIFSISIKRIIVLKNYYCKNKIIVCIKPIFGNSQVVFIKDKNHYYRYIEKKKNFNPFEEFKK